MEEKIPKPITINSFAPVVDDSTEILILGTMPDAMSLEKQEYYGYPRNQFWKIMYSLRASLPVPEKFTDKIDMLRRHNIGLWDVLEACERKGSLDVNIKNQKENDIPGLLRTHPKIQKILFNGKESHRYFVNKFGEPTDIEFHVMPSTSPANTTSFDKKLAAWQEALDK
ncbi:MAG TPA: DNA-deoxyinosine glycosylase [Flavobacterium sp.]|jgi:hypoxanthine-DNA glycosylase|nr:DNA-deoxyinosine glycosylase [Flavobacterium sp.]